MGQRGQAGDVRRQLVGNGFQLLRRRYLVDQADPQGLVSVQQAAGEQDVEGVALADQVDQAVHFAVADGDAQPGDGDAQPTAGGGDPQVGGHGQFAAAAGRKAAYHRDDRRAD